MIGRHAIHVLGLLGDAAEEIPSAHHHRDLHPEAVYLANLRRNLVYAVLSTPNPCPAASASPESLWRMRLNAGVVMNIQSPQSATIKV